MKVVRDWLPAVLGLAITTGIAPLLFVQILYKRQFYTANLLLFNRFMLLLPALIVAYYMLYLVKSHALAGAGTDGPRAGGVRGASPVSFTPHGHGPKIMS